MSNFGVSVVVSAIDRATSPLRQMTRSVAAFTTDVKKLDQAIEANKRRRDSLRAEMLDVAAIGIALATPVKAAMDFESAMADVRKVVDFKEPDGIKQMEKTIKSLSREIPISASGLASIVAAGGQLGIQENKLADFANTAAKMSVAFDIAPSEAGEAMAKLSNVFDVPIAQVGLLGDAVNHLSDNTAAKAPEITRTLLRVGGTAKNFGLSAVQTAALADAFIALGRPPEVAGTAINAMLSKLQTASTQGAKFQGMLKVLGFSAKEMEQAIGKDAQGALNTFLKSLSELDKGKRAKAAGLMFGLEYADDISILVGGLDKYQAALDLVGDRSTYAGSMTREFTNRISTSQSQMQLAINKVVELGINVGVVLLPALNNILAVGGGLASTLADLAVEFPIVTEVVMTLAAVMIAAKISAVVFGYGLTFVTGGALQLMKGIRFLIVAFNALKIAMMANPVGAVITVLTTGAALIYANWDKVKGLFLEVWNWITKITTAVLPDWLKEKVGLNTSVTQVVQPGAGVAGNAAVPGSQAGQQKMNGTMRVVIDQEGRARVEQITSDNPNFDIEVDAGLAMAGF